MPLYPPNATIGTDGWTLDQATWTYASATTFTVTGDQTAKFSKGTRIKLTQTTVKYFVVTASSYSSGTTTVTITGGTDYTFANSAVASPYYSYAANPQGYPGWFTYTPTWTNTSSNPAIGNGTLTGRFAVLGAVCHAQFTIACGSTTTYGSGTGYTVTAPITSAGFETYGEGICYNSGGANANQIRWRADGLMTLNQLLLQLVTQGTPITLANGSAIVCSVTYQI